MISRRSLLQQTAGTILVAAAAPLVDALPGPGKPPSPIRCINVINFIRAVEPRGPTDLFLPVQKQMEVIKAEGLPATWLLQYDALVRGPFVEYLKANMPKNHEVGFWFEMNEEHCKAAGVDWRGRPGFEWDSHPDVAFTIGYTPEERMKLADAAMEGFKSKFGRYPSSVASWNLDGITVEYLVKKYHVDAFAVCRDQLNTDGFTIWGTPIAGYYPSKNNLWSPALSPSNQIKAPVFRMLGQDPVYYYERSFPLPDGSRVEQPDTMEPVWVSGRSDSFIAAFLGMISQTPTGDFAYAQLGQENSFGWPDMEPAYAKQMAALAKIRDAKTAFVETMGESGRRFKKAFSETPNQLQIMLQDPYGNTNPAEGTIWFQSRYYRANLHLEGDLPFLRDLIVYSDHFPQPFLSEPTREQNVEQRMPAVLDGYHWSLDKSKAGGFFLVDGERIRVEGEPKITEVRGEHEGDEPGLSVTLPLKGGDTLAAEFATETASFKLKSGKPLTLSFEWDPAKAALRRVHPQVVEFRYKEFDYSVTLLHGSAEQTPTGWKATGVELALTMAQK